MEPLIPVLLAFFPYLTVVPQGEAAVVPTDVMLPGTQPGQASLESVSKCDNCHGGYDPAVEPAQGWRGSMMAHAGRDPLFWAAVAVADQDFPGAGDLCLRCHAAEGWIAGRSTPTDGSGLAAGDGDGVSCDVCHQLTNPDGGEHAGVQLPPFVAHDGGTPPEGWYGSGMMVLYAGSAKLGPFFDPSSPHPSNGSLFHRMPEMCGTCHDVSNSVVGDLAHNHGAQAPLPGAFSGVPGAPVTEKAAFNNPPYAYGAVERTFSEHMSSAFPTLRIADYAGLPPELKAGAIAEARDAALASTPTGDYADGAPRFFTCQTCHMPPTTGKGCDKVGAPVRSDLPLHDMTGGSSWIQDAIAWLDASGDLVLGGGMSAGETAAMQAGAARSVANLKLAAALSVDGDVARVVNLTGHKLPSGYPEGRRMWLHVRWGDAGGALIREDGAYGALAVTHLGQALLVDTLLAPDDPHARVWEAQTGLTQEWAAQMLGLGYDPGLPLAYDRQTGSVAETLGSLGLQPPGSTAKSFHFALANVVVSDDRIPPYGFRRDDALARSALPVPQDQYGDPGPGGVYEHADVVALDPPAGAATAELELLYQSTSWEYVQFLALANDGSSAFLAGTGEDLLAAWLATGMSPPEVMASASWTAGLVDCNGNGVDDALDIALGTSLDDDQDGVPDECEASLAPYGCGVNPAGSLVHLSGTPQLGDTLVLGADNPLGTQAPGAFTFLALTPFADPAYPCGTLLPSFGMAGPGAAGELLIAPGPGLLTVVGPPWTGPGSPAPIAVPVPDNLALLGATVHAQGLIYDASAAFGVDFALAGAFHLHLGTLGGGAP